MQIFFAFGGRLSLPPVGELLNEILYTIWVTIVMQNTLNNFITVKKIKLPTGLLTRLVVVLFRQ